MKKFSRKKIIIFAVITVILCVLLFFGNNALQITNYNYSSDSIPEEFDNFKIVQISDFKLLLAHEPQFFDNYSASDADLVLSGHAHEGQIRIPFTHFGIIAPDQYFFPEYSEGEFSKNSTTMIISRGLGNSIIPFRIFNRPEIVCVSLHCK